MRNNIKIELSHEEVIEDIFRKMIDKKFNNEVFISAARRYFMNFYKAARCINYDQIDIGLKGYKAMGKVITIELNYGNLYSYVLADGIVVPYDEWICEDSFSYVSSTGTTFAYHRFEDGTVWKESKKGIDAEAELSKLLQEEVDKVKRDSKTILHCSGDVVILRGAK